MDVLLWAVVGSLLVSGCASLCWGWAQCRTYLLLGGTAGILGATATGLDELCLLPGWVLWLALAFALCLAVAGLALRIKLLAPAITSRVNARMHKR